MIDLLTGQHLTKTTTSRLSVNEVQADMLDVVLELNVGYEEMPVDLLKWLRPKYFGWGIVGFRFIMED